MKKRTELVTLDNGAVIATRRFPDSRTTHVQWSVVGGSYAERADEHGVAHYLEHTLVDLERLYKPIKKTPGKVNAYTSNDHIAMWARVMPEHAKVTFGRLLEHGLVNPSFSEADFKRETGPIKMEITKTMSAPDTRLYYNAHAIMCAGQPMAHTITGTHADIDSHSYEKLRHYFERVRSPQGLVALSAGQVKSAAFIRQAETALRDLPPVPAVQIAPSYFKSGEAVFHEPPANQFQTAAEQPVLMLVFFQAVPETSPLRAAFALLGPMLTNGLHSPLMVELREKRGLIYSIGAFQNLWANDGELAFKLETSRSNIEQATDVLAQSLSNAAKYLTPERFEDIKNQKVLDFADSHEASGGWAKRAISELQTFGRIREYDEIQAEYERVTLGEIRQAADIAFGKSPFVAVQGPVESLTFKPVFDKALKFAAA